MMGQAMLAMLMIMDMTMVVVLELTCECGCMCRACTCSMHGVVCHAGESLGRAVMTHAFVRTCDACIHA